MTRARVLLCALIWVGLSCNKSSEKRLICIKWQGLSVRTIRVATNGAVLDDSFLGLPETILDLSDSKSYVFKDTSNIADGVSGTWAISKGTLILDRQGYPSTIWTVQKLTSSRLVLYTTIVGDSVDTKQQTITFVK
jgi:hypothetical protein